eukprot:1724425-Prymnesium_polylepis.2
MDPGARVVLLRAAVGAAAYESRAFVRLRVRVVIPARWKDEQLGGERCHEICGRRFSRTRRVSVNAGPLARRERAHTATRRPPHAHRAAVLVSKFYFARE